MPKYTHKGKPDTPAPPARHGKMERFILWARDGGRIAEIEVPSFRPRVEVLLWEGRSFIWHEKTRRYVEAVRVVGKGLRGPIFLYGISQS
jgi:hypothetical protein